MTDLRAAIRSACIARGLSIAELADLADTSRPNLSNFLAGKRELRSDSIERLLDRLDLDIVQRARPEHKRLRPPRELPPWAKKITAASRRARSSRPEAPRSDQPRS